MLRKQREIEKLLYLSLTAYTDVFFVVSSIIDLRINTYYNLLEQQVETMQRRERVCIEFTMSRIRQDRSIRFFFFFAVCVLAIL